ncbi:unnamed protein product [Prorocentrum cordatum]|uniref:Uncharacterized protein n=1 Tax=Prorocentrum cordatum TaxID=2364126 RepID=A0ABN9V4R9_9DINO|nr:unnamed protein product [Polarella glacialis]
MDTKHNSSSSSFWTGLAVRAQQRLLSVLDNTYQKPAFFDRYDLNSDTCITQDECDLQAPLLKNCTGTSTYGPAVWDLDSDGCLNYTEWEIIFAATNGSVCPVEAPQTCDECPAGHFVVTNPCDCEACVGGYTSRRRSLSCTPCPSPYVDYGDFDDCRDPNKPVTPPAKLPNGTTKIPVTGGTVASCDEFALGDSLTLVGQEEDCDDDASCTLVHTCIIIGVAQVTGGYEYECNDPLPVSFPPYSEVAQTCTSTDGTQVSAKYSSAAGGCCCSCGSSCCDTTEVCTLHPNGTGVCSSAGPYPEFSTPAPTVGAKGDPHLVNLQGEHFDINHEGDFTLLRFPQAGEKPAEFSFKAGVTAESGRPCTTYITQVELSGAWLGGKSVEIRCYRRIDSNDTAYLGARLLEGDTDAPWQNIEDLQFKDLVLSGPESDVEASLDTTTWFPKKRTATGPIAAGMFTLTLRHRKSTHGAKITIRQDLPGQEHFNVAMKHLAALGRVDVGGLLGFDAHPANLERVTAACAHHRAIAHPRIESQDEQGRGYYFRPAWKDRWDKVRKGGQPQDNEAAAGFRIARRDSDTDADDDADDGALGGRMCKCPSDDHSSGAIEGVLVEQASFLFAEASWE